MIGAIKKNFAEDASKYGIRFFGVSKEEGNYLAYFIFPGGRLEKAYISELSYNSLLRKGAPKQRKDGVY